MDMVYQERVAKEYKKKAKRCFASPVSRDEKLFKYSLAAVEDNEADAHCEQDPLDCLRYITPALELLFDLKFVNHYMTKFQSETVDVYIETLLLQSSILMTAQAKLVKYYSKLHTPPRTQPVSTQTERILCAVRSHAFDNMIYTVHYVHWWNGVSMYFDTLRELKKGAKEYWQMQAEEAERRSR